MSADSVLTTFYRAIDLVLKEPVGPKRWRAANNLWLSLSPKHQVQYRAVIKENAEIRRALQDMRKTYNTSDDDNSNLRLSLNIPTGAYYTIERADPDAFKKKENAAKMFKEFPEYCTALAH